MNALQARVDQEQCAKIYLEVLAANVRQDQNLPIPLWEVPFRLVVNQLCPMNVTEIAHVLPENNALTVAAAKTSAFAQSVSFEIRRLDNVEM